MFPDSVNILTTLTLIMLSCKGLEIGSTTSCFVFNHHFKQITLMEFSKADFAISIGK